MKVYELAKTLNISTLELMDNVKKWGLPIKSHMSSLDEDMIQKIRENFLTTKTKPKQTKKKVAKKKVSPSSLSKKTSTKRKVATTKKPGIKETAKKTTATKTASATVPKKSIILRKKTDPPPAITKETTEQPKQTQQVPTAKVVSQPQEHTTQKPNPTQTEVKYSQSNLRQGFSTQENPSIDLNKQSIEKKPRKDKVKTTTEKTQGTIFRSSDFRKREVVFQTKRKKTIVSKIFKKNVLTKAKASKRIVSMNDQISVAEFAEKLRVKSSQVIKLLFKNGIKATINAKIDFNTASLIAEEFEFSVKNTTQTSNDILKEYIEIRDKSPKKKRAPILAIMGHVDHGKTSLLDAIRETKVIEQEAGGITQHIGAYKVKTRANQEITFLDTPGHEAFTTMRSRGAKVTDIAIIVVAADDGIMPQTIEAINHAQAANVPILVAINKIDKPNINIEKVQKQLSEHNLTPEKWGGETIFCEVSALKKQGIETLLENIVLLAEMLELDVAYEGFSQGVVIESHMTKGLGFVATVLVKEGCLKLGQFITINNIVTKIRTLMNDSGMRVKQAFPGDPVQITGFSLAVEAGYEFYGLDEESPARTLSENLQKNKEQSSSYSSDVQSVLAKFKQKKIKELPILLKTDVFGSLEAITEALLKLKNEEIATKIIHSGVGAISDADILLATSSQAIVLGFNIRPTLSAQKIAKEKNITIHSHKVIYELLDETKKIMGGLLTPDKEEKALGQVEVREIFNISKVGTIAGCFVLDGKINRAKQVRLVRDGKIIYDGEVLSLKKFKDDAKEVEKGYECGVGLKNFNDIKVGDIIESYTINEIKKELVL